MRILILEDDLLIALNLQFLLEDLGHAVPWICDTLASAEPCIAARPDFAFLDVDLPDGKSFGLAGQLNAARVPCCFVSASLRSELPDALRGLPFVAKPFAPASIRNVLMELRAVA